MCSVAADGRFQEDILQECELGLVAGPACADRCSVVQSRNIISDNYPHNTRVTAHVSRVYMHTYHCTRVTIHTCHYAHVSAMGQLAAARTSPYRAHRGFLLLLRSYLGQFSIAARHHHHQHHHPTQQLARCCTLIRRQNIRHSSNIYVS